MKSMVETSAPPTETLAVPVVVTATCSCSSLHSTLLLLSLSSLLLLNLAVEVVERIWKDPHIQSIETPDLYMEFKNLCKANLLNITLGV